MTSVGVISSAVARIKFLKEIVKPPESLPPEAEQLLKGLEGIMETLREGHIQGGKSREEEEEELFGELEKKIVRLSYEIVDAIVDTMSKSKDTLGMLSQRKKSRNTKLPQLQEKLNDFQNDLKSSSGGSELQAAVPPEQDPESSRSRLRSTATASQIEGKERKSKSMFSPRNMLHQLGRTSSRRSSSEVQRDGPKKMSDSESKAVEDDVNISSDRKPKERNVLFDEIKEDLLNPSSENSVVYIVGESGMGKTTFTRDLLRDPQIIESSFKIGPWVSINQNFQMKRVLQLLLLNLMMHSNEQQDIRDMNEIQLISHIFAALQKDNNNHLLVLDDIAALDDWESIRLALPSGNSTKVIVTTSSKDFLDLPNSHQIPGLTRKEMSTLLNDKASFPTGSEKIREAIFDISGGSPLLATILGISLRSEAATPGDQLFNELETYKRQKGTPQVLGACYKRLVPEWKPCLLYLAQFPQGHDIDVEKLYQLFMAENLILSQNEESKPSLQSLIGYLEELRDTELVQLQKGYKSCRLHDQVREFCKFKGLNEEFFEIADLEHTSTKVGLYARRLAIYLSKHKDADSIQFESPETVRNILSLLIFDPFESAEEKLEWPSEINDLKEFIHARVVSFDGVDFTVRKVPKGIDRLFLLRYLSFRGCKLEKLPDSMSNLTQLETLDLVVHEDCEKMLLIPANIFAKMTRMLHLYLPRLYAASEGKGNKVQLQNLERLEILINFDTEACDVKDLSKFKNLNTLSTISSGQAGDHLEHVIKFINEQEKKLEHSSVEIKSFNCYNTGSASALKKLLECQFVHSIHIQGRIGKLTDNPDNHRAEKVEEIFLDGSEIEVDPMNYLGTTFPNLQSLVLTNDAFLGSEIVITAKSLFPKLRSMKLKNLQYLKKLTIEQGALMPELSTLIIEGCGCLEELSIEPKKLRDRLLEVQGDSGGDLYSVMLLRAKSNSTPPTTSMGIIDRS